MDHMPLGQIYDIILDLQSGLYLRREVAPHSLIVKMQGALATLRANQDDANMWTGHGIDVLVSWLAEDVAC